MQADKREQEGKGNNDGNYQGRAPVEHKQGYDQCYQQDPFNQVMHNGMGGITDQLFPVVKGNDLYVRRQYAVIQFFNFFFERPDHFIRILALAHQYDGFHGIIGIFQFPAAFAVYCIGTAYLTQPGHSRHLDVCHVFCEHRNAMYIRSEEHTSELQSLAYLVCRLLLEKKKKKQIPSHTKKKKKERIVKTKN